MIVLAFDEQGEQEWLGPPSKGIRLRWGGGRVAMVAMVGRVCGCLGLLLRVQLLLHYLGIQPQHRHQHGHQHWECPNTDSEPV